jgi:hypothetical protein
LRDFYKPSTSRIANTIGRPAAITLRAAAGRSAQRAFGFLDPINVFPARRIVGAGVHEAGIAVALDQRQRGQERQLRGVEPAARPFDRLARFRVHGGAYCARHGVVVVALHRHRAARHVVHHRTHHPARVGAIADQVAGKGVLVDALPRGMGQAGFQRLAIGVQIGQVGQAHGVQPE